MSGAYVKSFAKCDFSDHLNDLYDSMVQLLREENSMLQYHIQRNAILPICVLVLRIVVALADDDSILNRWCMGYSCTMRSDNQLMSEVEDVMHLM